MIALVPLPNSICPSPKVEAPVPPCATAKSVPSVNAPSIVVAPVIWVLPLTSRLARGILPSVYPTARLLLIVALPVTLAP